jgi:predicted RNA binding protein YcfA (HicA-like mRNA interferase family)
LNLSAKYLIKLLEENDFRYKRAKGSHHIYFNSVKNITVVVPVHGKDLKKGTFLGILKQAGIERA